MYTPNFIEIGKSFCGRTDVPTDGHFRSPLMLLGRLEGGEIKNQMQTVIRNTNNSIPLILPMIRLPDNSHGQFAMMCQLKTPAVACTASVSRPRYTVSPTTPYRAGYRHLLQAPGKPLVVEDHYTIQWNTKLECGPMPNVMAALPNIGGALCSTLQSSADAQYWSAVQ